MKVNIQSIHFNADKKLIEFVQERLDKLTHYYDAIISGDVALRLENASSTENKVAEIRLSIPGNDLFAKRRCKSFEEAIDNSVEALRKQAKKRKEKVRGL